MSGRNGCKKGCVTKKRYDDLLVENRALKEKIKALEMGKLPVNKVNSSDPIDSGSSGFETAKSSLSPTSDDFDSADAYVERSPVFSPVGAKSKKRGKKKNAKKSKGRRGRGKGKTVKRIKG